MINLTKEEFAEVIGEVVKELDMPEINFSLITIGAMIGARAEMKTEKKEDEEEKHEAVVEYSAGKWDILIATKENDTVRLCIRHYGAVVCDRILDSLYKAYNYAFNILCV